MKSIEFDKRSYLARIHSKHILPLSMQILAPESSPQKSFIFSFMKSLVIQIKRNQQSFRVYVDSFEKFYVLHITQICLMQSGRDSNPRPSDRQSDILPLNYRTKMIVQKSSMTFSNLRTMRQTTQSIHAMNKTNNILPLKSGSGCSQTCLVYV